MKTKKNIKTNTSWGGRFKKEVSEQTQSFTSSLNVDRRLYLEDIIGSIEYAKSLKKAKILKSTELKKITSGLKLVLKDIESGNFNWSDALEDVHMNIEAALVKKIGLAGKKIHTGRSRNDQIATDMKLYLRSSVNELQENITFVQLEVVKLAEKHYKTIMPGFTHMQIAQPVTLGHHMMAWYEMLQRDFDRFKDSLIRMNSLPLGSAALSGSRYKIDRKSLATNLGFSDVTLARNCDILCFSSHSQTSSVAVFPLTKPRSGFALAVYIITVHLEDIFSNASYAPLIGSS